MRDAVRHGLGQLQRIGAADQQVPGVQAQRDRRTLQHPVDVGAGLDHGADVRVQHRQQATLGGDGRPAGPGWRAASPTGPRRGRGVSRIRRNPVAAASTTTPAPAATRDSSGPARSSAGSWSASCSTTGTNPPTHARSCWRRTDFSSSVSVGRKPSGPSSVAVSPAPRISPSTRSGCELVTPAGHLAHTPGDRRACDLDSPVAALLPSVLSCVPHVLDAHRDTPAQGLGGGLCQPGDLDRVGHGGTLDGAALGRPPRRPANSVRKASVKRSMKKWCAGPCGKSLRGSMFRTGAP